MLEKRELTKEEIEAKIDFLRKNGYDRMPDFSGVDHYESPHTLRSHCESYYEYERLVKLLKSKS